MSLDNDPILRSDQQVRREVEEEFDFHFQMVVDELLAEGMSEREAQDEAERRFGSRAAHLKACRRIGQRRRHAASRRAWWFDLSNDLRFSWRTIRRAPLHTALVLLTLALTIGATTLVYSLLDGVVLRPLALEDPERAFVLWQYDLEDHQQEWVSAPNFKDWQQLNRSFDSMAAYSWRTVTLGSERPERLTVAVATPDFFRALGATPALGQVFDREVVEQDPRIVVASHSFWLRHLGGREDAIGTTIEVERESYTVVGVMPPSFEYPGGTDLWGPLVFEPRDLADRARGAQWLIGVGRLADGVSADGARADLERVAGLLTERHPDRWENRGVSMVPLRDDFVDSARSPLGILFGGVSLVLLIGVINVVGLSVARAAARRHELGVRAAIGAGRARIVRQLIVENILLALLGGAAGVALAFLGLDLVRSMLPVYVPRLETVSIDSRVLAVTAAVTLLSGLVAGLWPAWRVRTDPSRLLQSKKGTPRGRRLWGRRALVVVETALSVVLVIAVGLLLRTFLHLGGVDLGFDPRNTLTFGIGLPDSAYPEREEAAVFFEQLDENLSAIPGVMSVGLNPWVPPDSGWWFSYEPPDGLPEGQRQPSAAFRFINDSYFEALRVDVLAGRPFLKSDRAGSQPVIVINRALAERHFGDGDPSAGVRSAVGKQMFVGYGNPDDGRILRTVVGVVENTRQLGPASGAVPSIYVPHLQLPFDSMTVALRSAGDPMLLLPAVEAEVKKLDPQLAVERPELMSARVSRTLDVRRFMMSMLAAFAALALVLAVVGVYGVMAQLVIQRQHEIGVRLAIGANRTSILSWVFGRGLLMATIGVGLGLVAAAAALRILESQLVGVSARDPLAYFVAAIVLLAAAALACWLPARRAARLDPLALLRSE